MAKQYKKIDYISMACEDYEMKEYFLKLDLKGARIKFRERSKCMQTCMTHFSSDKKYLEAGFQCMSCNEGKIDTLLHWRDCVSHSQFRESRNLESDYDLVSFYQDIIQMRLSKLEK